MKTYTTVDKSDWDRGPWDNEPDKMSWTDEATGLPCLIFRNRMGALCGYAGVAPGHPWHGKDHNDVDVDVHGGLTYADRCQVGASEAEGICHIPEPGASDDVWWFGFDTAHSFDLCPATIKYYRDRDLGMSEDGAYRNVTYVSVEVAQLAAQLAAVAA